MAINYTSLLALIQPVDGTEVSVWGDDVNNGVSSILDVAVAGTQNITTDGNVTLTITQATSSGTNLSGTSAQYAILLLSGARTATRTITLPASSKTYTVMNSTTGGYAQTVGGLTIAVGEVAKIVYNISTSTWMKASTYGGSPTFGTVTANNFIATASITGATNQAPYSYGTLSFTDVNIFASMQSSVNNYNQFAIQNTSSGTAASAGYVAYNDGGTATTNFMTVGINSSGYSGTGSIGAAGYGYLLSASTDMVIGTIGANGIHFTTNSSATDALAISSAGAVSLPGGTANGVAYLNGSKVLTTGSALTFDGTNLATTGGVNLSGRIGFTGFSTDIDNFGLWVSSATSATTLASYSTNPIAFRVNAAEQMRLTSTGLGIGTSSPAGKLQVAADNPAVYITDNNIAGSDSATLYLGLSTVPTYAGLIADFSNDRLNIRHNSATRATFDSSGNLGLGVTPSAWNGGKAFEFGSTGNALWSANQVDVFATMNAYQVSGGTWKYASSNPASVFEQYNGNFYWKQAGSGTAGNAISFTQAMTLFNSGGLSLGNTTDPTGSGRMIIGGASTGATGTANTTTIGFSGNQISFNQSGSSYIATTYAGSSLVFQTGASVEAARIDSSGNLLVGTTSLSLSGQTSFIASKGFAVRSGYGGSFSGNLFNINWTGSPYLWIDSTNVGQIATVSDYRLKENVVTQSEAALPKIMQINPVSFNRKQIGIFAGSAAVEEGFIAHELQAIIPSAVHGNKDALTEDGGIQPQSLNWAPIVSVLTKAIQELKAEFDAYKASHP